MAFAAGIRIEQNNVSAMAYNNKRRSWTIFESNGVNKYK